jgi:sugar (pentulose or hexulose) kinase
MTMAQARRVAVIDIGKTNAKVALVDLDTLSEIALRKMPNRPLAHEPYPHHDVEALWVFILESLQELGREHRIDAISVTTHGATAVLLDADGGLAMPVLDYEHDGPDAVRHDYDAVRPAFDETGSPPLPLGLNLGAQLYWQARTFPEAFSRATSVLMYPQYWAWRLCGVAAGEVTSLGCHTDLWSPARNDYSTLVDHLAWRALFPPIRPAQDRLGPIHAAVADRTGLDPATPVFCGIHDSNASLLPHLLSRAAPFSVVSTGTWVVCMAIGTQSVLLDPARDTLINVNALGDPVPSARFMGGREFEMLTQGASLGFTDADVRAVVSQRIALLPSVQQGSGPFPAHEPRWTGRAPTPEERAVAISFYLALMTATCLDLVGAEGETIVEGAFAANTAFLMMLKVATDRPVLAGGSATGTSIGAACLAAGKAPEPVLVSIAEELPKGAADYAARWRLLAGQG